MENNKNMITLENHLASFSDRGDLYKKLYNTWLVEKRDLTNVLKNIVLCFPHYSLHDASHSNTILMRMEQLLGEKRIAQIGPTETWLLLMSAYTHDLGMLFEEKELAELWASDSFQSYLKKIDGFSDLKGYAKIFMDENLEKSSKSWPVQVKWAVIILSADYFRRSHAQRSADLIRNQVEGSCSFKLDLSANGFIPKRFIYLLSKFAELHGAPFDAVLKLDKIASGMGGADDLIYLRRVAALLRLADLLDMDNGRFDENAYPINGKVPETTLAHQKKHSSLRHFLVIPEHIEIELDCPDEDSFQAASSWVGWIEDEIREISVHWTEIMPHNYGSAPVLANPKILLKGKKLEGNTLASFKVDSDSIFELLEGANIYKNKFSCIRELIQNALDATKIRFWNLIQHDEFGDKSGLKDSDKVTPFDKDPKIYNRFPIKVDIVYNQKDKRIEISVQDHGAGITNRRLKQMMQVGESEHTKTYDYTIPTMPRWLLPTGAFGLGLQSVFQLTDTLECKTQPEREAGKKLTFRSHRIKGRISSINLDDSEKLPIGTTFSFSIPVENIKINSFPIGGEFAEHYMEMDPFSTGFTDEKLILPMFYIIDCLKEEIGNSMFPIQVSCYYTVEQEKQEIYKNNYSILHQNSLKKEKQLSDIVLYSEKEEKKSENGHWLYAYDVKNDIGFKILDDVDVRFSNRQLLTFKGMFVDSRYLTDCNFYLGKLRGHVDFLGFPTREYLSLNREEIRRNKKSDTITAVYNDVKDIMQYKILNFLHSKVDVQLTPGQACFYSLFLPLLDKFKENKEELLSLAEKKLFSLITHEQNIFTTVNGEWNEETENLGESFKRILSGNIFYIYTSHRTWASNTEKPSIELIDKLYESMEHNSSEKKDYVYMQDTLSYWICLNDIKVLQITSEGKEGDEEKLLKCVFNRDAKGLPKLDLNTKQNLLKDSLLQSRILGIACTDYPHLALDKEQKLDTLYYIHRYANSRFEVGNNTFALTVSPFSKEDIEWMKKGKVSFDEFWAQIHNREDFRKLVGYVCEHKIDCESTKDDVINDYRNWIQDAIKLNNEMHEKKK
ncbi:HD domain-containing protein [Acidaminococcus massiliensis]|uniref:HD domain-containing protein n=1 Tax=Acidaminococcus massiliensis TaxID=1852375 RepID=UPI0026DD3D50|nr:ATP-binding protein [Acidaminococcus massiliensis]